MKELDFHIFFCIILTNIDSYVGYTKYGDHMYNKQQQIKIASILQDIGLDDELISIMTSLSQEELKQINN